MDTKLTVDEIVAVAQRYSTIAAGHPDVDTFLLQVAKAHHGFFNVAKLSATSTMTRNYLKLNRA